MKPGIIICFVLFSAASCWMENSWADPSPASATSGNGLFNNPADLFPDVGFPVLVSHFERVKIQSTWRGFYLRADTQPGFSKEWDPSEAGLYLDVGVRGSEEILKFEDSRKLSGKITQRTIEFPATKGDQEALRIIFVYGAKADSGAVSSINKDIEAIIKAYKVSTA